MASPPLTIWTNVKYPDDAVELLRTGSSPHQLIFAAKTEDSNLTPGLPDASLSQSDIAFGQPDPDQLLATPRVKWVHLNTAGYTRYDRDDLRTALQSCGAILTNSSTLYANPCAQHILALMLAVNRQLPASMEAQRQHQWLWKPLRFEAKTLTGQTALIAGFGSIARRLVELLQPFNMNILATRRSPGGEEPIKVYPQSDIAQLLPQADHVINILPESCENEEYFDADLFKQMKTGAAFYNIGRGSTVDTYALRTALETHKLAAAYLDVTMPEPPDEDDLLWTTPHCYITPHIAGGQQNEYIAIVQHFLTNLNRYMSSRPLLDRVF